MAIDPDSLAPTPIVEVRRGEVVFETRKGIFRSGSVLALADVDLRVDYGQTVSLVGESGSGKTTLGRLTLRLVEPSAGNVFFDGQDISHASEKELKWVRERAQIVFQDPFSSLNPYMRVRELIEEPLIIDGVKSEDERRTRVDQALESVDLAPVARFAQKFPTQMSGGQRQRVGIARALVRNPDYIVTDEPVSMIDASSRVEVLNLLDRLQEETRTAFLYITHDIASARHFADKISVMYLGTVVETGTPARIIDQPLHPYTRALIAAIPEPDPNNRFIRRDVVPGEPITSGDRPTGCPFFSRCPQRMTGVCDIERPLLIPQADNHAVACFLYEPVSAVPSVQAAEGTDAS